MRFLRADARCKTYHKRNDAGIAQTVQRLGYGLDGRGIGVRSPTGTKKFPAQRPDWLWGALSLLSRGYRGLFLRE
jgi:hypothetical protein